MDTLLPFALLCFTSFFTLTNPLGTMPVFLTMTKGMDDDYYEFDEKKMLVFGKRTKKSYRLGDKVVVSVAKVDRMMGTIDFVFEKENEDFQE